MRLIVFLTFLLGLSACQPLSTYYKEGVSVDRLDRDNTACDVRALREAPVANQTLITPPRYVPTRRICDGAGKCVTKGGFFLPGEHYTVDVNAELRARVKRLCMADKGYSLTKIPNCPIPVERAAPPRLTKVLPPLTPKSCVIRRDLGIQIVNQI